MTKCKKCDIELDTLGSSCPLCGTKITKNADSTYPEIKSKLTSSFVKKLLRFIVIFVSLAVLLINKMLTPNIKWSGFVIAGLISMYIIFRGIMRGRKRMLTMAFYMCFLIILITIFWDYYIGYRGWSLNYVLPSICISYGIFLIVLRFVSYFAFRENSNYIYLNVLLEFVPLVLYYTGYVTFKPLSLISAILGIVNLLILVLFDTTKFKNDLEKNLHI